VTAASLETLMHFQIDEGQLMKICLSILLLWYHGDAIEINAIPNTRCDDRNNTPGKQNASRRAPTPKRE